MTLFRLDASITPATSQSRALADLVEAEWAASHPESTVCRRDVGTEPVPATAWGDAVGAGWMPEADRTPAQRDAVALAATLVDELADADAYLFAVPLYNFGPSQHFKTWVDLVIADPRMGPGAEPLTAGKPAVLATVQGGNYAPGTPKEGWDHATEWMRRILEDVWQLDLSVVSREFTLVGVNPALDAFTDLAAGIRTAAEGRATQLGRLLAERRRAA